MTAAATLQANTPLCLSPMRRIGLLVTWELLDPLHPGRDAGKACLEVIKPQLQWSCFGAQRGPQQELQVRIGDDIGSREVQTCHPDAAFGISFQPGETEVNFLARFFRLVSAKRRPEENRAAEALVGRPKIRAELRNALENPAGFLGSAPEKRRVRVLAVEIDHDRKGFVERKIAVADRGDAAERIDNEELRGLEPSL